MSSAVILAAAIAYFRFLKSAKRTWFLAVLLLQVVGFLCKEDALIIPALLALTWAVLPEREKSVSRRSALVSLLCSTALSMALFKLTMLIVSMAPPTTSLTEGTLSPLQYLRGQLGVVIPRYLKMTLVPISLAIDHHPGLPSNTSDITALLLIMGFTAFMVWAWSGRRRRLIGFAAASYLALLVPTSTLVPLATVMDEHRLYLPLAFYYIALSSALVMMIEKSKVFSSYGMKIHSAMVSFLVLMSVVNGIGTSYRNAIWRNEYLLWKDVVKIYPNDVRAYANVAFWALKYGRYEEAKEMALEAIRRNPMLKNPYSVLGSAYIALKEYDKAMKVFKRVIQISPHYYLAYYNLALLYLRKGDIENARKYAEKALSGRPFDHKIRTLVERLEKGEEAIKEYYGPSYRGVFSSSTPSYSGRGFPGFPSEGTEGSSLLLCPAED